MTNIIFYFGVFVIVGWYIYLVVKRFKEEDRIDLKEHFWIIIVYIILLIITIIVWRIIYFLLTSSADMMIKYNNYIEKLLNG